MSTSISPFWTKGSWNGSNTPYPWSGRPTARYSIGASSASQSSLLANFVSLVPSFVARNA